METLVQVALAQSEPTLASSAAACDTCRIKDVPLYRYDVWDDETNERTSEGAFAFCSDSCFSNFLPMNQRFLAMFSRYRRDKYLAVEPISQPDTTFHQLY